MKQRKLQAKVVVVAILAILLVVLVVQNTEVMVVHILFWDLEMSRVVLILLSTVVGFAGGFIVAKMTGRDDAPAKSRPGAP